VEKHPSLEARCREYQTFLVTDRGLSPITAYMRMVNVRRLLGKWRTLNPTVEQVRATRDEHVLAGYDRDYVRNIVLSFASYGDFIGADLRVKPPSKQKPPLPRFLTEAEVQAFLFAIDSIRDRAIFGLLAYSGLRVSECCHLRREDVNFQARTIAVRYGKGGKSSEIPVARPALDAVSAYLRSDQRNEKSPMLFHAPNGKALSTQRIRVLARRYGQRAGLIKRVSPHMFRHALATNLLGKGCPLPFVQRQLRHSKIETTMRYLHLNDTMLKENYDRFVPNY